MDEKTIHAGVFEGLSRVLRELLRTPKVRESARLLLNELDPENAPLLVRVLRSEDPDLFMNGLSASPKLANALAGVIGELLAQVQTLPPGLTAAFAGELVGALDGVTLGRAAGRAAAIAAQAGERAGAEIGAAGQALADDFLRGYGESIADAEVDAGAVSDRLTAAALSAGTAFLKQVNENAAREGSATGAALGDALAQVRRLERATEDGDE